MGGFDSAGFYDPGYARDGNAIAAGPGGVQAPTTWSHYCGGNDCSTASAGEVNAALVFAPLPPMGWLGRLARFVPGLSRLLPAAGRWIAVAETMSARAAAYQARIAGRAGQAFLRNGVKFDGFANGVLLEAKGPGYATFVRDGVFQPWFRGAEGLVSQAQRQVAAAGGTPIQWHFAEEAAADATRSLFNREGISGIQIIFTP